MIRFNPSPNSSFSQNEVDDTLHFSLPAGSTHHWVMCPTAPATASGRPLHLCSNQRQPWETAETALDEFFLCSCRYFISCLSLEHTEHRSALSHNRHPVPQSLALPHISTEHLLSLWRLHVLVVRIKTFEPLLKLRLEVNNMYRHIFPSFSRTQLSKQRKRCH